MKGAFKGVFTSPYSETETKWKYGLLSERVNNVDLTSHIWQWCCIKCVVQCKCDLGQPGYNVWPPPPCCYYSSWLLLHGKDKTDESATANTYRPTHTNVTGAYFSIQKDNIVFGNLQMAKWIDMVIHQNVLYRRRENKNHAFLCRIYYIVQNKLFKHLF